MTEEQKIIEETIAANEKIRDQIEGINRQIDALERKKEHLATTMAAPCSSCPYDGLYRCEACQEENFLYFNVKDWQNYERTGRDEERPVNSCAQCELSKDCEIPVELSDFCEKRQKGKQ